MRRIEQVAKALKKELAPRVEELLGQKYGIVTLTDVKVQSDLKEAHVYVSCLDSKMEKKILQVLEKSAKDFQHFLGRRLQMRYTPKIIFRVDKGYENVDKVERLLSKIDKKKG